MFWLDRNTVPTMGDYFRTAGYRTYYRGKWHISHEDIVIPGTHSSLASYDPITGVPDKREEELYAQADRLDGFGFTGWIGPEPHGRNPRNSASSAAVGLSGRDEVYAAETVRLIELLDRRKRHGEIIEPWLIVASFVNPHDIVLYGDLTAHMPMFRFDADHVPEVPPPPTFMESLAAKPRCQASYRDIYPRAVQPITDQAFYRRLYYQLQKNADRQMSKAFDALTRSSFYDNTIVIFTSDHGDLLGAHGRLHQKWYCAYEEILHVPFLIHNKHLFPQHKNIHTPTSHVDLLPTMLGLAGLDIAELQSRLRERFCELRPFVGRDLTPIIMDPAAPYVDEPIYFMTDDDVTRGQRQINAWGEPYPSVAQPNHIESVITTVPKDGKKQYWKLSRYFDNDRFWSHPGIMDITLQPVQGSACGRHTSWATSVKTLPVPDEYELYNLTEDPLETCNLARETADPFIQGMQSYMLKLLEEQRKRKRLNPS